MSYQVLFNKAQIIHTNGDIFTPLSYKGPTNFIIPDTIVNICIDKYNLMEAPILDPMCGIGTIPRIINQRGGDCIGIEINKIRFQYALENTPPTKLFCGNFIDIDLSFHYFNCIFTSMPFDWFKPQLEKLSPLYSERFKMLLRKNGFVLLDSVPFVNREGEEWSVAAKQAEYFEENDFVLVDMIRFNNDKHADITNQSVIMKFIPN